MHSQTVGTTDGQAEHGNSLYAALARTLTRSAALYFSRPVRLFRPSKVSGWMFLQGLASQRGVQLSPKFLSSFVKQHGLFALPRHFIPPLAINAFLGTVLWSSYSEASTFLEGHISHPLAVSFVSGAFAGAAQAIVAAPAENVRIVLEGGGSHAGWSDAWKDVFLCRSASNQSKAETLREARQIRLWMREVGDMAGRGWKGLYWGLAKDSCGFAIFFSMFELTKRTSIALRTESVHLQNILEGEGAAMLHLPRVVYGASLVTGGVLAGLAYEMTARPFDEARRVVHAQRVADPAHRTVAAGLKVLSRKVRVDGLLSFFRSPATYDNVSASTQSITTCRRRMLYALRFLGRMGPWGAGFLIWEAFGPGLAP